MGCETACSENPSPAKALFLLLFIVMIGGLVLFSLAHATERHGDMVTEVCSAPIIHQAFRQWDNRQANVCQLPDGRFGIMVCEKDGGLVTCFIKEKMKELEDVLRYLQNRGYQ